MMHARNHAAGAELLKGSRLRVTLVRLLVLDVFLRDPARQRTADDVVRQLHGDSSDVPTGTVYRALADLVRAGLLKSIPLDSARMNYELAGHRQPQSRMASTHSQVVEQLHEPMFEEIVRQLAEKRGWNIDDIEVSVFVIRPANCTKKSRSKI